MGKNTTTEQHAPVRLPGTWKMLTADGVTWCGIRTDGTAWCWGRNDHGQVGDGTTIDRLVPVRLP